jgi:NTP pyrophosphatase (non-canonical NTP hydrolase)
LEPILKALRSFGRYSCDVESDQTIDLLRRFRDEREWGQFHSPENLAKSICIESAELLECFQWSESADHDQVANELADVLTYCYLLADLLGENPEDLIRKKLEITRSKYPVEESRGRSLKYDQL